MKSYDIDWNEFFILLGLLQSKIKPTDVVYGFPKGGMIITNFLKNPKTHIPEKADIIIDDIIDSGKTMKKAHELYKKPFIALVDKREPKWKDYGYIIFPYEDVQKDAEDVIVRMIEHLGENPNREGLLDTPKRVVKSWKKIFGGYEQDPKDVLVTQFTEEYDQMIVCKNIEFYSTCEHHMLPFYGIGHIAYIPNEMVVGLSKMPRLLEVYARRMQIQERLTEQVSTAMYDILKPRGAGVILEAKHHCMVCRGVEKQNSSMITTSLKGVFKELHCKQEFQRSIK